MNPSDSSVHRLRAELADLVRRRDELRYAGHGTGRLERDIRARQLALDALLEFRAELDGRRLAGWADASMSPNQHVVGETVSPTSFAVDTAQRTGSTPRTVQHADPPGSA